MEDRQSIPKGNKDEPGGHGALRVMAGLTIVAAPASRR